MHAGGCAADAIGSIRVKLRRSVNACARVLRPDNTVGQASSAALKIIDATGGH
jgi:hypothetical protein